MYHILVVDDEPSVSRALTMLLAFDGHEVESVDCAEDALTLLDCHAFDLIITDCNLGQMRGDELAATIRKRRPAQPIIMVTAYAPDLNAADHRCIDCIVEKPFAIAELRAVIKQVMSTKDSAPFIPPPPDFDPPRSFC